MSDGPESRARLFGGLLLALIALWILHGFLRPLAWAVVLGVATWPLHRSFCCQSSGPNQRPLLSALLLTVAMGALLLGPFTYGLLQVVREADSLIQLLRTAQSEGLPPPDWLSRLPWGAEWARETWTGWLGTSAAVRESLDYLASPQLLTKTRAFAAQLVHRYVEAFFTIVALFFVYRDGSTVGEQVLALGERLFGRIGRDYVLHAVTAVRATVNGIVLVALGQGVALGFGYAVAGLQHPALLGALTVAAAFIPFAAKLVVLSSAAILLVEGHAVAGVALIVYGVLVVLVADNYLRPALIGGAVQLPFIWTLLGILGGIETLGLLGLFLGPAVMAVLMSIWRDWIRPATPVTVQTR